MRRFYTDLIHKHFCENRQMLLLMGPRQVGKTTLCKLLSEKWNDTAFLNWDDREDRLLILEGPRSVGRAIRLETLRGAKVLVIFDEIHKFEGWKDFLKGFFDLYESQTAILVTGSARLDSFRKSGDSLMGRYFSCSMHPISVAELVRKRYQESEIFPPKRISNEEYAQLLTFGGFPEPFLNGNKRFYNKWRAFRFEQLFREEMRDLTQIQNIDLMEVLAELLQRQVGQLTTFSSLAKKLGKSDQTVRFWLKMLANLYFCFEIRPWAKNVTRSLIKEPKYYLWDWSLCDDEGSKHENFIASHLLKAVHYWTDCGFGKYHLYYVRDKDKREVDFLVTKDQKPWILIEVKSSDHKSISNSLNYFQEMLDVPHAFQVVIDMPYVNKNCFEEKGPIKVPAKTFLSQLV